MGMLDNTHAWSITLSVVFVSFAVGMAVFAALVPSSKVTAYLAVQSAALVAAVAVHGWGIYKFEKDRVKEHNLRRQVDPKSCPDYWTGRYDSCTQSMVCDPHFDTGDIHNPRVFMNGENLAPIDVVQHSARGADQMCVEDEAGTFPWMEVSNSCDARGRAV
eukprot:jgi/Tetstr1/454088/TSEL_041007.t1